MKWSGKSFSSVLNIILLLILSAVGISFFAPKLRKRFSRREKEFDPCGECQKTLTAKTAHRVVSGFDDEIESEFRASGGGTAMMADFCKDCCPGNCGRKHG